jgi:hypothetical protein
MTEAKRSISRAVHEAFLGTSARSRRVVISWAVAGGITTGGLLVGLTALGSPETAQGLLPLAPVLFLVGAVGGVIHGSVLAYLGRAEGVGGPAAAAAVASGILLSIPALVVAWVAAAWISLTPAVVTLHVWSTTVVTLIGWLVGTAACCWAAVEGWEAFCSAFARWPESRPGALLLVGAAAVLAALFVHNRPGIWGTDLRVTGIGALILALVSTIWIALPIIVVLLRYLHRRFASVWDGPAASEKIVQPDL